MSEQDYQKLFSALQNLVDQKTLSTELGKSLVKEINRWARKEGVPAKYNPDDLELTPAKFAVDVGADSEAHAYLDDESSDY